MQAQIKDYTIDKTENIICSLIQFTFEFWVSFDWIQQLVSKWVETQSLFKFHVIPVHHSF